MKINPVAGTELSGTCLKSVAKDNAESTPVKKVPSSRPVRLLKSATRGTVRTVEYLGYLGVLFFALWKTPGAWVAGNKVTQKIGMVPTPITRTYEPEEKNSYGTDSFFDGFPEFKGVLELVKHSAPLETLDINGNHILLDTQEEVEALRDALIQQSKAYSSTSKEEEIKKALEILDRLDILNQIIWGENKSPHNLVQGGRPNCQLMATIQSHYLTPENLQILKRAIKVTDFNLSNDNFYINSEVLFPNKEPIKVNWQEHLIKWISPQNIVPSLSKDGALSVPILTYGLEKELKDRYDGVPPTIPSGAPNLLTGKEHSVVNISFGPTVLPDNEFIKILKKAPQSPVLLCSYGDINEIYAWINKKIRGEKDNFEFLPYSNEKANKFASEVSSKANELSTNTNSKQTHPGKSEPTNTATPTNTTEASNNTGVKRNDEEEYKGPILAHHVYVVKQFNEEDNTVTIMDSHGLNRRTSIEELKKNMWFVVTDSDNIGYFTQESFQTYLLALVGGVLLRKGSNKLKKKLS